MRKLVLPFVIVALAAGCEAESTNYNWDGITDTGIPDYPYDSPYDVPYETYEAVDTAGMDNDYDGFTPLTGDCNDAEPAINPNAFDAVNGVDDDCDGFVDNPTRGAPSLTSDCDCGVMPTMIEGMDLCDGRFVTAVEEISYASGAAGGRGVRQHYGNPGNDLNTRYGCSYAILDTGNIDPTIGGCNPTRQIGTDFYDPSGFFGCTGGEPDPNPLGSAPDAFICDTNQLAVHFKAPSNALSFSFDFLYMSAEYPEWVMMGYNDTFYAILMRPSTADRLNISFDDSGHEIEVDNAFFESPPVTNLAGTGYSDMDFGEVCGSSTGWLRTSWNINPNEEFVLTFSIHDEGDGIYDSMVILDNFQWAVGEVDPGTVII